mmetsp:Transcript_53479/g.160029  ORF Transcript_53479/g.160029 Transcript_53479/m.160029 type:complete len:1293 (-) Transcript_53479:126-4004(-)
MRHVAEKIGSADDAGALRLYSPVMRMMGGALKRLFAIGQPQAGGDALRSACVKFLEIVVASFSSRVQPGAPSHAAAARKTKADDFALEDLPTGHPVITREALEEIGEYAYTALRGLVIVGGQVKIDPSLLAGAMNQYGAMGAMGMAGGQTPSSQIVDVVKPAALAYLEIESSAVEAMAKVQEEEAEKKMDEDKDKDDNDNEKKEKDPPDFKIDRSEMEVEFALSHKSYALAINAVAMLAANRPVYYRDSAMCLARRVFDPPKVPASGKEVDDSVSPDSGGSLDRALTKAAVVAVRHQLRSSCITLLRNSMSVTSGGWDVLRRALARCGMDLQASKALKAAQQQAALKNAGRAARNRAAIFYEWDQSAADERSSKRQRMADDALAKLRKDKAARGLGRGIQLPSSMVDATELVLANLSHLPKKRPPGGGVSAPGRKPATLDFVIDAIMTNGASLSVDESKWYERDGGAAWTMEIGEAEEEPLTLVDGASMEGAGSERRAMIFSLDDKTLKAAEEAYRNGAKIRGMKPPDASKSDAKGGGKADKDDAESKARLFDEQCLTAASDAFGRVVARTSSARSPALANFGNQIAARLAWTLRAVGPSEGQLQEAHEMAKESVAEVGGAGGKKRKGESKKIEENVLGAFADEFPLVSSCLALDAIPVDTGGGATASTAQGSAAGGGQTATESGGDSVAVSLSGTPSCLANRILNEAYLESIAVDDKHDKEADENADGKDSSMENSGKKSNERYERTLELYVASVVRASERANDKPNDAARRKVAARAATSLPRQLAAAPSVTPASLSIASSLCDIEDLTKKAAEAARKSTQQTQGASKALVDAKTSAEKRATQALLALRDAAFQRSRAEVRRGAVNCAVGIAAGRLPASANVEDKALKLVMNVLFPKAPDLADAVVKSASDELERTAAFAVDGYSRILAANEASMAKKGDHRALSSGRNQLQPHSDEEKAALERVRKPVVLFMALCVRRPDIITTLMSIGSRPKADVLAKAIRNNMQKLARAVVTKYGAAKIALQVAEQTSGDDEVEETKPLFLTFLGALVPTAEKDPPGQDLIDACHEIQSKRPGLDGKLDAQYIVPVVSGIMRDELVEKLPHFVSAEDDVFKAALHRMGERLKRYALVFRDEPNPDDPSLKGMTLCEQMVYLHRLDFSSVGLPQKKYLDAIRICLDDDEVFSDRVIMAALDYISGTFLAGEDGLPLAFMRTIILTCSKHESLHSWICHVLLPRLIEGKVYNDRRQWEGWMRCAKMLENAGDGVSSLDAIEKLPEEQLRMYRAKYPKKG